MASSQTDGVVHKFSDGVLEIHDGAAADITVAFEDASFTFSESVNNVWHRDRGTLDHRRAGKAEPVTVSFSCKYTALVGQAVQPYEAIKGVEGASGYTSTTAATSDVYSVDLVLTITDAVSGAGTHEIITIDDFAYSTVDFAEGDEANTLSFSGDATSVTVTHSA